MSYEVVKTIRGHKYRYAVESFRDSDTEKVRNKWRYLGKADSDVAPRRRSRAEETRAKLMDALEGLLADRSWHDVTAHAIARAAGVAEATLYRYFHSRVDVLSACAHRVNDRLEPLFAALCEVADDAAVERRRLRAWSTGIVKNPPGAPVLFALWVSGGSDELRRERHARRQRAFMEYLHESSLRGFIAMPASEFKSAALALSVLMQTFSYRVVIERHDLSDGESTALAMIVDRIVFAGTASDRR